MSVRDRGAGAFAGLAAALAGLGAAQLVALVVAEESAPLVAVADAFVDLTPPWLKQAAIDLFGTADKLVLLGSAALVLLLLSAAAGLLAVRHPRVGLALVAGLAAVAALAAITRPNATPSWILPSVVGGVVGMLTLDAGIRRVRGAPTEPGMAEPGMAEPAVRQVSRRGALTLPLAAGAVGLVAWAGGSLLGRRSAAVAASRAAVRLPVPTDTVAPAPTGTGSGAGASAGPPGVDVGVQGVGPWLTPNDDFYRIDTALIVPKVTTQEWSLRIHGMVERELTLDFAELTSRARVERYVTLACVSNAVGGDLVGNALWQGLPIADLIAEVRPLPGSDMLLSTSVDGFTCGTPVAALTDGRDALLAIAMNGEPLPIEHGFPVRMVVPGLYGYVSATKWVVEWEFTRFDRVEAYWTPRGWAPEAPVKTASRIDVPRPSAQVAAGEVTVAGVAWAQHRGITGVQVRVDEGPWQDARLAVDASVDTWRQWAYRWQAPVGEHTLQVRARDASGQWQTSRTAPPAPDGATGWHTVRVVVV
jgi:DMSO/TMAO reductase YedYZ molybdopterin-dependent catalytic subunit